MCLERDGFAQIASASEASDSTTNQLRSEVVKGKSGLFWSFCVLMSCLLKNYRRVPKGHKIIT